jgi:ATP-binding cassette subfamily B protein
VYRAAGQGFFALGYGGAIAAELYSALHGHASAGDLVLVITLAVQVSVQVSGALSVLSLLQVAARTTDRIGDLRAVAAAAPAGAANPAGVPGRLTRGITLEDVSFTYPGAERPVLAGVSVHIPAGSVLALVGENGAGKSTLVKLLCGLYQPTSGRILIDGQDLAGLDPARWRARIATLFQDFHRIELTLGESIGHGDIARAGDTEAVSAAAEKARADRVLRVVPGGLTGYVGHSYCDGTELSGGQWQTVGLARTLIAVLDHGQLTECGTHRELMTAPGLYAELFTLQARAYH